KKFDFANVKTASTPIKTQKPLVKDKEANDVDVHLYRSMIGSLMYLTASRPDIMFAVCACSRVSLFDLESYSDSDYAGANLDRKSTTGGCQFIGRRLISWQCKKHTIVATSTTKAEYVAAASCCGQIVKNPVYHSKTKHIAIRHHFIRDAYEKKLIQVSVLGCFYWDDKSISYIGFRRVIDATEALLLPTLFILWLDTVSTDSAKLVPLGKTTMPVLESCPKHNMVAYLENTDGNAEFHEIIDFLMCSSIHHGLT
ncbi:hypothetical protein Tco_0593285, partial [Tanacetum coccineum]